MKHRSSNKRYNYNKSGIDNENIYYNIDEYDLRELDLLSLQINSIIIFIISDIFFYESIIDRIEIIYHEYDEDNINIQKAKLKEILAVYLEFISKIILVEVDFKRNKNLYERFVKGEINFSFQPNINITGGDLFAVLTYFFLLIGVVAIYKRNNIKFLSIDDAKELELLSKELDAINIRVYGDYLAYISTNESMESIYNKYRGRTKRIHNPDVAAVQSAEFYLLSRTILANVNFTRSNELYKKYANTSESYLLQANVTINIANVFGVISCIYVLVGVIGVYDRNIKSPIFGI